MQLLTKYYKQGAGNGIIPDQAQLWIDFKIATVHS